MDLERPDIEPFEPILRGLIETAFFPPWPYPQSVVEAMRGRADPSQIVAQTIAAYSKLQLSVAENVVALERDARRLTDERKVARRARDSALTGTLGATISVIQSRQLVLRRLLDVIVWMVCEQYVWLVRRLLRKGDLQRIDPETLPGIVALATRLNQSDPYTLHLASDLTTVVQIGDLLQASIGADRRWHISLVEVKEGEINRKIAAKLADERGPEDLRTTMGDRAAEQAERMLKQQGRMKGLADDARTGRGRHPETGWRVARTPDAPPTAGYQAQLRSLVDEAASHGPRVITIDGCLTLAAVRVDSPADAHLGLAIHAFYHHNHPAAPCLLNSERLEEEWDLLKKEAPVVDLVEHSFVVRWGEPIFSWGTLDRVCDLVFGRIKVYAQFHIATFMERARGMGMQMKWVTRRRSEELRRAGATTPIPGGPGVSAILVTLLDGTRFEIFAGSIARIIVEMARPDTVLRYLLESAPHVRQVQEEALRGK